MELKDVLKNFVNRGKLEESKKKTIEKILLILIIVHLILFILSFFTGILSMNNVVKNILIVFLVIFDLGMMIYAISFINKKNIQESQELKREYNPILVQYMLKNSLEYSDSMVVLEMKSLMERGFVKLRKTNQKIEFELCSKDDFKRIEGLEKMNRETIENYSTEKIPSYENLFVTKILFPFEDKISLEDLKDKLSKGYYKERLELSGFVMEKMLVFEMEKDNMIISGNSINKFSVLLIANMIITLFYLSSFHFNILLFLGNLPNLAFSMIMLKNEKIFSYLYTDLVQEDINKLEKTQNIRDEAFSKKVCNEFFNSL